MAGGAANIRGFRKSRLPRPKDMHLWNWLLPNLFVGVHEISYVQAMGVLLLSKILFGGFRGHGDMHSKWHQSRLANMTPEEREKFQSGLRGWCGRGKSVETGSKE